MSQKDDFLRDFFKNQYTDGSFEESEDSHISEENNKKRDPKPDTIITRYAESQKFTSSREINLKALFEGIEKAKKEHNQFFTHQLEEDIFPIETEKNRRSKKEEEKREKKRRRNIQDIQDKYIQIFSIFFKNNKFLEEEKSKDQLRQSRKEEKVQKKTQNISSQIESIGEIQKKSPVFQVQNIKSFTAQPQKKKKKEQKKNVFIKSQSFTVQSVIRDEKRGNTQNISQQSDFTTPFSASLQSPKTEESIKKGDIFEKREKNHSLFRKSRNTKEYIPDIWESHPERIPYFEVQSLSNSHKKVQQRQKNSKKKIDRKKLVTDLFSIGKKKIAQSLTIGKKYITVLQKELGLYSDNIRSVSVKYSLNIKYYIEELHKQRKEKQSLKIIENKKLEKNNKIKAERESKQRRKREADQAIVKEERKKRKNREEKKIQLQKELDKKKKEQFFTQFSPIKGKTFLFFIPHKKDIKEWAQIAGMVASVFIIGVVGLRLPGLMSQYESVWNADFFSEQQASVSFLLDEKPNPFENIKSLPVAGNISVPEEQINFNEFLNINPPDTRIVIPKIAKNIPILQIGDDSRLSEDWKKLESDIQDALQDGVVHYPGTALPGEVGNVFITGHSSYYPWDSGRYKDVFAALHNLEVGDEYFIFHKGKKYRYIITTRKIVPPSDVSVLDQDRSKKESTLMTCTPVGTAKNRLILKAEQVSIEY